jgi:hypothetical protein
MAALRQAFLSVVTEESMKELGQKLLAAALAGDWQAVKLFLPFVIGRPAAAVNPDTLDREEWIQCQEWPELPDGFAWLRKIPFAEGVRIMQRMSESGQGSIIRLSLEGEPTDGQNNTPTRQDGE